jgi:Ser/Thr protein kinase RdoA (MazF antagonist)
MEKAIKNRYHDNILHQAMARFGIAKENIRLLDGFESFMYEFEKESREYILRIGHSRRRSTALIQGEVDWINYLAAGGAGVSPAILSDNGALVEAIDDGQGDQFLATAFVKAKGGSAWPDKWNETLFERYGRLIGKMHALSKDYQLSDPAWKRPQWDDPIMLNLDEWLPPTESIALDRFETLLKHLHTLPKDQETYGLIHQDAHGGNFFVDDDYNITLFDFDDCAYSWYANDIAIVLFYAVTNVENPDEFGRFFWSHFWRGYGQENQLDSRWLPEIPHFLKLREIDLYAVIHRSYDVPSLKPHSWEAGYMNGRKERIENNVPYLALNFEDYNAT